MPIVSVIVPVYKVEKYLKQCLDSIISQSFSDFECILVDDGSPDNCPNICDQYSEKDKRFRVIHQRNKGLSAARNTGIENSTGEWICFIDSDDCIHPDYISILYSTAKNYDAEVVSCGHISFFENDDISVKWESQTSSFVDIKTGKEVLELHYKKGEFSFNVWDKIYKRDVIINYRFPVGLYHEDQYYNTHVLPTCTRIVSISNSLYGYRLRNSSITGNPLLGKDIDRIVVKHDAFIFCKENGYKSLLSDVSRQYWRCFWKYIRRSIKLNMLSSDQEEKIISYCKELWKAKYYPRNPLLLIASFLFISEKLRPIFYQVCRIM